MAMVEASNLSELVWLSQMRATYPDSVGRLAAFQDREEDAPASWRFVEGLRKHEGLLGVGQWPRPEDCGPEDEPVWLDIQCTAMGSGQGRRVKEMRIEVLKLLAAAFHGRMAPGPVVAGQNLRDSTDARIPYNLDNRCALQVALVDKEVYDAHERMGRSVRGAAVVYLNGPAMGYLPLFAVAPQHRGSGLGRRFAKALVAVLRALEVDAMVVEAVVGLEDDQQVLHFWEDLCGLERCSDEYLDRKEDLTNMTRLARVNGASMRQMSGMWAFIDSCFMFCGTRKGWVLDTSVVRPLPELSRWSSSESQGATWVKSLMKLKPLENAAASSWTIAAEVHESQPHQDKGTPAHTWMKTGFLEPELARASLEDAEQCTGPTRSVGKEEFKLEQGTAAGAGCVDPGEEADSQDTPFLEATMDLCSESDGSPVHHPDTASHLTCMSILDSIIDTACSFRAEAGGQPDDAVSGGMSLEGVSLEGVLATPEFGGFAGTSRGLMGIPERCQVGRLSSCTPGAERVADPAMCACCSDEAQAPESNSRMRRQRLAEQTACVQSAQPQLVQVETASLQEQHREQPSVLVGSRATFPASVRRCLRSSKLRRAWSRIVRCAKRATLSCMPCIPT
jgi:GNAT superfamily N-acetyltransferase